MVIPHGKIPHSTAENAPYDEVVFGLSLTHSINSQPMTLAVVYKLNGKVSRSTFLTIDQFIMQVTGEESSPANPMNKNLMLDHGIAHCFSDFEYYSQNNKKYLGYYCPLLTDLVWRVRYKRDPFNANLRQDSGWAALYYGPSLPQRQFLMKEYKLTTISDFILGEDMFRFFNDIQDTAWQNRYKNL